LRALEEYSDIPPLTSKLVQLTPTSLFAWDSHMRALRALGRFEEASEAIDRFLELVPDDERIWTIKADNMYRLGRYRESAQAAERALHYNQEFAPARRIHEKAVRLMYQRKEKRHK
jgi:tetratricopeptide (TPR) repeat protein